MSIPTKLLGACALAVAAAILVRSALGQEAAVQVIATPDGNTITLPAGAKVSPEMLERMRSGHGPPRVAGEHGRPGEDQGEKGGEGTDEKEEDKDEGKEGEKDKEKKDEEKKEGEEPEEKPEPVKRESTPPEPADPKELEVRPNAEGLVEFNFVGQKWLDVLEWLAEISNMSLDWQELPGDYLNLTTQRPYTVRETRDLINYHLLARGYTLLNPDGVRLSVVKIDNLDPSLVPRVEPDELKDRDPHEYVKVSFALDWLLAEAAVEELKPMLSPNGKLSALKATNRLEAMDAVANLRDVHRVLGEEQSGTGQERLVREFPLQHALAEDVLGQLEMLLGIESKRSGPKMPMTPDQMRAQQEAMRRAQQEAQKKKGGSPAKSKPEIYLVANKRKNSILANAPPDKMAIIEQAIEAIDVPSDHAHSLLRNMERMQVYRLESMEPKSLITTLEELGDLDFDTRLEADEENNAIIAYASLADHLTIHSLVEKLDSGGRRAEVIQLDTLRAESVAKIVDFMMGGGKEEEEDQSRSSRSYYSPWYSRYRSSSRREDDEHEDRFRVDADVKNNSLLLWCNDFELAKVQDLLRRLEENQREGVEENRVEVYRLVTLEPEPFVKTLEAMETLGYRAKLEVDVENNSIVAYATEADHAKIRELIDELDGSGRTFHLFPLRRLEADYVAGTIAWMMAGKEESQQSGYSRTYVYNEYYGGGPSSRGREKKPDEFRVDADVEYNRLLLWANEVEMEEVKNLLVKLGEIPPEEGDTRTIRVLDILPGPEQEKLLERIRRVWPSLAPNPLVTSPAEESKEEKGDQKGTDAGKEEDDKQTPASPPPTTAAEAAQSVFRFARLEEQDTQGTESAASEHPEASVQEGSTAESTAESAASQAKPSEEAETPKEEAPQDATDAATPAEPENTQQPAPEKPAEREAPDQPQSAASSETPAGGPPGDAEPSSASERPPAAEKTPSAAEPAGPLPPVSITQAPDGRLIITSEDTEALDKLEELVSRLAPPRRDFQVFHLQYAEAYWVKWNLEDFFEEEDSRDRSSSRSYDWYWGYPRSSGSTDTTRRLSQRRPLKFISDDDTNTILVQGATPDQLRTIQDLIDIYDQPPSTEAESARKTEVFAIRYSKAEVVAEAVKDVYRDLLSDRDKSLAKGPQQQPRSESRYSYTYVLGDDGDERRMPRWKGYLSIGVDDLSNTLIVSAPEFLFRDIERLIEGLDEAAKPTDTVQAIQLGRNVSATVVQDTLSKVLSEAATSGKRAGRTAAEKPGEGRAGRREARIHSGD